jgi:hypothetical protein
MSALWFNAGIDYLANIFLNSTALQNLTLRCFVNNHAPAVTDTFATFTECTLGGYAALTLTPGTWSGSTAAGLATYAYPAINFTFNPYAGGTTIYGYLLTIPGVTAILGDLLGTPYAVPAGGGILAITPTYQDQKF